MIDRIIRAIRLEPGLFREVANSEKLMGESVVIILGVALLSGIGSVFNSAHPVLSFFAEMFNNLFFGWILWSLAAYFVGTAFFQGQSSINQLLRAVAYASAPRLLGLFSAIPCFGWLIAFAGWILSLIAVIIAIREAMKFDTDNAVVTALVGFVLYLLTSGAIRIIFSGLGMSLRSLFY